MSLSSTTQGFLKEVESSTGLGVVVEEDPRLQAPLLAKVQVARRGIPFHRVAYNPSAHGMADCLVCYQCAFVIRLHSLPSAERFDLTDNPVAQEECLGWAKASSKTSACGCRATPPVTSTANTSISRSTISKRRST